MKKYALLLAALSPALSVAGPYVGIQVSGYFLKNQMNFDGKTLRSGNNTKLFNISANKDSNLNVIRYGLLFGYSHNIREKVNLMIEADVSFASQKEKVRFDTSKLNTVRHFNENAEIKTGFGLGIMPAVNYQIKDKLSGILGVRFNAKQYQVKAYHVNINQTTPQADRTKTEKKFLFNFEPTVGAKYDFTDKVSGRMMMGYNFGTRKTVVGNYWNDTQSKNEGVTGSASINPKGVVVRGMVTYNF